MRRTRAQDLLQTQSQIAPRKAQNNHYWKNSVYSFRTSLLSALVYVCCDGILLSSKRCPMEGSLLNRRDGEMFSDC